MADDISGLLPQPGIRPMSPGEAAWKAVDPRENLRYAGDVVKNLPGSVASNAAEVLKGAAGLVPRPSFDTSDPNHPKWNWSVPTMEAVGHLVGGLWGKVSGQQVSPEYEAAANAFINHYKENYGSMDKFAEHLRTDPAGVLADISAVAAPVEGGMKTAAKLAGATGAARSAQVLGRAGEVAANVSDWTNPVTMAGKATEGLRRNVAQHSYEGALRPTSRHGEEYREPAAQEGIRQGIKAGRNAEQQIWDAMKPPMAEVDRGLAGGAGAGMKVNLQDAADQGIGRGLGVAPSQATPADIEAAGPVYRKYMGGDRAAQHATIDITKSDLAKGWGIHNPGSPGVPAVPPSGTHIQNFNPGSPAIPPTPESWQLGNVSIDTANKIKKDTYRDVEKATRSQSFDERSRPAVDAMKGFSGSIAKDIRRQLPQLEAPLNTEANLMTLEDMLNPSDADILSAERTSLMGTRFQEGTAASIPLYSVGRMITSPQVRTRFALGISPDSPTFNRNWFGKGPTTSGAAGAAMGAGAVGRQAEFNPPPPPPPSQPDDVSNLIPQMADGGVVAQDTTGPGVGAEPPQPQTPPAQYQLGDKRKINGITYIRDQFGTWHSEHTI